MSAALHLANEPSTLDLRLATIQALLDDPEVTEITINRPGTVRVERGSSWETLEMPAIDHAWCDDLAKLLANFSDQHITSAKPLLGAELPGGQRVQIVAPPAVAAGTVSVTIRRPPQQVLTVGQLIDGGAFTDTRCEQSVLLCGDERTRLEAALSDDDQTLLDLFRKRDWAAFLQQAVLCRKNIVSSGATSSGKTTLGNALAALIPHDERVITVEDVAEMRLPHPNQVNLFYPKGGNGVSQLVPRDLLEAVLRMRPDRVLLAELRGDETFFFIQNVLNSGHPGTITTVHATRAKLVFKRLALMIKGSAEGGGIDMPDILDTLYALVDVVAQMKRTPSGRRVVSEVYFDPAFAAHKLG